MIGAAAILLLCLVFVARGMRIALVAQDGFSKLLAVGPHVRLRAADVHHRRGRAPPRAVDGHHAARSSPTAAPRSSPTSSCSRSSCSSPTAPSLRRRRDEPPDHACRLDRDGAARRARGGDDVLADVGAADLGARQDNEIQRVAEFEIRRGPIVNHPSGGSARRASGTGAQRRRGRSAARRSTSAATRRGKLTAHVVGYSTVGRARAGLERSLNDVLTGTNRGLGSLVDQTLDELGGKPSSVTPSRRRSTSTRSRLRSTSSGSRCGAVAAFDPRTGQLLVMASSPSYDPNYVENRFDEISAITADCTPASPLLNRASAGLYPPGLDLQGGDGQRGARVAPLHARLDVLRPRATASRTASA